MRRSSLLLIALAALAGIAALAGNRAAHAAPATQPDCAFSGADQAWLERALAAWQFTSRELTGLVQRGDFKGIFFDAGCVRSSDSALTLGGGTHAAWTAARHGGQVTLPDGSQIPAGVTSFSRASGGSVYFVMSTPSVWRAGGVSGGEIGLETMMVAVLLHEGSHVAQGATYGHRMEVLAERYHLPESFNDDSLQQRFQPDAAFSASVARETDLLFQAALAPDRAEALRLTREARTLMRAREDRYFVGDDAYYRDAEDIWLTMEGSGQWAGYQWVISPRGAAMPVSVAIPNFARRSRWWSQNEGLGLFLALDRLAGHGWKRHVYGDGAGTILQLLDAALAAR